MDWSTQSRCSLVTDTDFPDADVGTAASFLCPIGLQTCDVLCESFPDAPNDRMKVFEVFQAEFQANLRCCPNGASANRFQKAAVLVIRKTRTIFPSRNLK